MKNRKRDIIFLFICTLPVSALLIFIFVTLEEYGGLPFALVPQAFMALCIAIMFLQEKHVLKRERKLRASEHPRQWKSALEKYEYENSSYRNIRSGSMSKDLKRIYRTRLFPICLLVGLVSLVYPVLSCIWLKTSEGSEYLSAPSFAEKATSVICLIFGALCILTALYEFLGLPVYFFRRKNRADIEAIERSYMEGKMVCGKLCGLNVGFEYCVYYDLFSVCCFSVRDIAYAETVRKIKKEQSRSGFYHKVKQDITLELRVKGEKFPYNISVNDEQLENICGELTRRGVRVMNKER